MSSTQVVSYYPTVQEVAEKLPLVQTRLEKIGLPSLSLTGQLAVYLHAFSGIDQPPVEVEDILCEVSLTRRVFVSADLHNSHLRIFHSCFCLLRQSYTQGTRRSSIGKMLTSGSSKRNYSSTSSLAVPFPPLRFSASGVDLSSSLYSASIKWYFT